MRAFLVCALALPLGCGSPAEPDSPQAAAGGDEKPARAEAASSSSVSPPPTTSEQAPEAPPPPEQPITQPASSLPEPEREPPPEREPRPEPTPVAFSTAFRAELRSELNRCHAESNGATSPGVTKALPPSALRRRFAGLRRCYETRLKENPRLEVKLVPRFRVHADGCIELLEMLSQPQEPELAECIGRQLVRVRLPPSGKSPGNTTVTYPMHLSPG